MEKMEQTDPTIVKPSGTDGSDYSKRMDVESWNQKVAKAKKRLPLLLFVQAMVIVVGAIFATSPGTCTPDKDALVSVVTGLIFVIISEYGRRQSRAFFLGLHRMTQIATAYLLVTLGRRHCLWKVLKFEWGDFHIHQACLIAYLTLLVCCEIHTSLMVDRVFSDMLPQRKASSHRFLDLLMTGLN